MSVNEGAALRIMIPTTTQQNRTTAIGLFQGVSSDRSFVISVIGSVELGVLVFLGDGTTFSISLAEAIAGKPHEEHFSVPAGFAEWQTWHVHAYEVMCAQRSR